MAKTEYLRLKQAAESFGVSTGSIRNWIRDGRLNAIFTPGGHRRIRKDEFDAFRERYLGDKSAEEPNE